MTAWLYSLSSWHLALLISGGLVIVSVAITWLSHRLVSPGVAIQHDLIEIFSSSCGVLYSVLLAMIAMNAWQNFDDLNDIVTNEAYYLGNIYRDVEGYPEPLRREVRNEVRDYLEVVLNGEWPELHKGVTTRAATLAVDHLFLSISQFKPADLGEAAVHAEVLQTLNKLSFSRRERITAADESVMPILWTVVWVGAFVNIVLNTFTSTGRERLDYLLISSYALNIGLVIFLIFSLDHPFLGETSVTPEPFLEMRDMMDHIDRSADGRPR